MKNASHKKKRKHLLKQFCLLEKILKGTINSVCVNCSRAQCICSICKNKNHKKAYRLTYKDKNQKTKIIYVPKKRLPEVRSWLSNHLKCKKILDQLIELTIKEFKMGP